MNINLHIERLILDGLPVDRNQASHVQLAVEAELTRLLVENGLSTDLQAGGAVLGVRANGIQFREGCAPAEIGTQIAQSVYGAIGSEA
jgi:hypothetical protein